MNPRSSHRLLAVATRAAAIAVLFAFAAEPSEAVPPKHAEGVIIAVRGQALVEGQTFTISDGAGQSPTFEFVRNGDVNPGNVAIPFNSGDNALTVATRIRNAINSHPLAVNASGAGAAVGLVNDVTSYFGNLPITETVTAPEFTVLGMAGGTDVETPDAAAAAWGILFVVRGAWLVDGDKFTISDGAGQTMTFEFDGDGSGPGTIENVAIPFALGDNANTMAIRIRNAINSTLLAVEANSVDATVRLFNEALGPRGNLPITENVTAPEFAVVGMLGGTDVTLAVGPGSSGARVTAFPNPFRATMLFQLGDHARHPGTLRVLDVHGVVRCVSTWPNGLPSEFRWNGRDARGQQLPAGVYFYEVVSAGAPPATGRLIKVR